MQHEPVYNIKTKTTCPKHITVITPKLIAMVTSARDLKRKIWLMVRERKTQLYFCFFILQLYFYTDDAQRYHCSYCGCDITLRLKCAICLDFDLCLEVYHIYFVLE